MEIMIGRGAPYGSGRMWGICGSVSQVMSVSGEADGRRGWDARWLERMMRTSERDEAAGRAGA